MLHPLLLPKYPGRRANFHLHGSPTIHPLQFFSELPSLVGRPLELLSACLWLPCPLSVCPPPSAVFGLGPSPCQILGVIPPECPFISLPAFVTLPSTPPPCWPQPAAQSLPVPRGFCRVFFFFTLCIHLALVWMCYVLHLLIFFLVWEDCSLAVVGLSLIFAPYNFSRNCLSLLMWWV